MYKLFGYILVFRNLLSPSKWYNKYKSNFMMKLNDFNIKNHDNMTSEEHDDVTYDRVNKEFIETGVKNVNIIILIDNN